MYCKHSIYRHGEHDARTDNAGIWRSEVYLYM